MKIRISILAFAFFCTVVLYSQDKFEVEYRINLSEVPSSAQLFVNDCAFPKKIKWYKEESQDGTTFEAKTKYHKYVYSIEFDDKGNLIDVEKKVKFKELDKAIQRNILASICDAFAKFKIVKTQIQKTGNQKEVQLWISQNLEEKVKAVSFFELVIKGKSNDNWASYEVLLSSEGKIVRTLKIGQRPSDNLEF